MGLLHEVKGKASSKRAMGMLYMLMGLVFILIKQLFGKEIDFEVLLLVVGTGAGLLGLSILTHFGKNTVTNETPK